MPKRRDPYQPYFPPQGGQGMLGRPSAFMSTEERYPRGYTPERWREVNEAMRSTRIRTTAEYPEERMGFARAQRKEADQVRQVVARSTIPTENLRRLQAVITGDEAHMGKGTYGEYTHSEVVNWRGQYGSVAVLSPRSTLQLAGPVSEDLDPGEVHPERGNAVGRTLIHELGHHRQNLPHLDDRSEYAVNIRTREFRTSGIRDEADAENYADRHFRPDRRISQHVNRSGYDKTLIRYWATGESSGAGEFIRTYKQHRNLSRDQFDPPRQKREKPLRRRDPGPGQMSLLEQEPEQMRLW